MAQYEKFIIQGEVFMAMSFSSDLINTLYDIELSG